MFFPIFYTITKEKIIALNLDYFFFGPNTHFPLDLLTCGTFLHSKIFQVKD